MIQGYPDNDPRGRQQQTVTQPRVLCPIHYWLKVFKTRVESSPIQDKIIVRLLFSPDDEIS